MAPLPSNSANAQQALLAMLKKEATTEWRSLVGVAASTTFGFLSVIAIAYASFGGKELGGTLLAGQLWVALTFAAVVGLPRLFLHEHDQKTLDLLRLWTTPEIVYWGKFLFALLSLWLQGALLTALFILLMVHSVASPSLLCASLLFGLASIASVVTLCGSLAVSGSQRSTLAAAIALPLLFPLVMLCVTTSRAALGDGNLEAGWKACLGLAGYAAISLPLSPYLYKTVWKD